MWLCQNILLQTWSNGKNSLRSVSIMLNQQGLQLFWAQRGSRGWDYSFTTAAVFFLIWSQPSSRVFQSRRFSGSEKCWWDSCVAALVQLKWVTTGWSKALAWPWTWLGKWEQGDSKDTVSWASTWTHKQGLVILNLCVFFSFYQRYTFGRLRFEQTETYHEYSVMITAVRETVKKTTCFP